MAAARGGGSGRSRQIDRHVGEQIRLRRTELGLTQDQLADALKVSYQQIQKYESGANRISAGRIFEIAHKLDVDIGWFFAGYEAADEDLTPARSLEHGGRQRTAIELVRKFGQIESPEVRAAIAGLVKSIVDRKR
jgi:transcriptional regulator with XRE-family HTH domain